MRHPITGRRISREKYAEEEAAFAKQISEMKAKEQARVKPYDVTGNIIAYETDGLPDDEMVELFQHLVDSGLAWELQGSYGRTAAALIEAGEITAPRR